MPKQTSKTNTSGTTQGTTSNTATYGQIHPESNKYIDAYAGYEPQKDPTIAFGAAAARNRLNSSFLNPAGGYSTPQRDEAIRRAGNRDINQQESQAFRQGAFDVNQSKMGQLGSLAALMAPRLVQTGSSGTHSGTTSGTSNTSQGQNLFGNFLDVGMGAANAALL